MVHATGNITLLREQLVSMSETAEPKPGPNPQDSREEIVETLRKTDHRALTAGMIAEESPSGLTRKTIYNRIGELVDMDNRIHSDKIGGSTAYWYQEPQPDGYGSRIGNIPVGAITPLASDLGIFFAALSIVFVLIDTLAGAPDITWQMSIILAVIFLHSTYRFSDKADPSYEWKDLANSLYGGRK